eukprot:1297763-Amphidinium_carterae.1
MALNAIEAFFFAALFAPYRFVQRVSGKCSKLFGVYNCLLHGRLLNAYRLCHYYDVVFAQGGANLIRLPQSASTPNKHDNIKEY